MKEGRNWDNFLGISETSGKKPARKRRFPYRKAEDIEKEIHDRESAVEYFQQQLSLPENLRHGERVRHLVRVGQGLAVGHGGRGRRRHRWQRART